MLVVTTDKILSTLGVIAENVDNVKFIEVLNEPPRFGEFPETKVIILLNGHMWERGAYETD